MSAFIWKTYFQMPVPYASRRFLRSPFSAEPANAMPNPRTNHASDFLHSLSAIAYPFSGILHAYRPVSKFSAAQPIRVRASLRRHRRKLIALKSVAKRQSFLLQPYKHSSLPDCLCNPLPLQSSLLQVTTGKKPAQQDRTIPIHASAREATADMSKECLRFVQIADRYDVFTQKTEKTSV